MSLQEKLLAGAVGVGATVPGLLSNDLTTPVIGVGVSTIAGAVLGTYAAIGYDDVVRARGKMFTQATATVIIACAATGFFPKLWGWTWINGGVEGGAAALAAVVCYYALPEAIPATRRLFREFKFRDLKWFKKGQPDDHMPLPPMSPGYEPPPDSPIDGDPRK